jgi:hypothetical protein
MLHITEQGISYEAEKKKENRTWNYLDIQYLDRLSNMELVILTYEGRKRYLGRDRQYHFVLTDGELSDELFQTLSRRLDRPVTNRVVPDIAGAEYAVPVKHLHTLGGCEGELRFTKEAIYYVTDQKEEAREWLLARDVQSAWSADPYRFEIHAYDNNRREFSRTRIYRFDLKRALDPAFYRDLKLKLLQTRDRPSAYETKNNMQLSLKTSRTLRAARTNNMSTDQSDSLDELRELVAQHGARYEVWPEYQLAGDKKVAVGYSLELYASHDHEGSQLSIGCERCQETYNDLKRVAEAILPQEKRDSRYEIAPFNRSIHLDAKHHLRGEVVLKVKILHQENYFHPVDECEEECLVEMKQKLDELGAQRGR